MRTGSFSPAVQAAAADTRAHVTATPAHFVPDPPEGAETTAPLVGATPQFLVSRYPNVWTGTPPIQ